MKFFRAVKDSPEEIFKQLSALDKMCVGTDGWSAESFLSEAEKDNGIVLYIESNNMVIGLICGYFAADEADITSVAVSPEYRRKGFAELLMKEFEKSLPDITNDIFLEVRESNSAAIALYEKCGFYQLSIRKKFYTAPDENAVVMKKILNKEG